MLPLYILYALAAMVAWGVWVVFTTHALDYTQVGPTVMLTYVAGLGVILTAKYDSALSFESGWGVPLGLAAGVAMGVGTLAFYRSLSVGGGAITPAIAGLYFLVPAVYEVVVLGHSLEPTRIGGLLLACAAIVLLAQ